MTTNEIAKRLVELCKKGDFETAQDELFSEDAVSVEQHATAEFGKETKGLKAIKEKGKKWNEMVEKVHGIEVSEPLIASDSFAVSIKMHVTMKNGQDMDGAELCVYETKDGKITKESFSM